MNKVVSSFVVSLILLAAGTTANAQAPQFSLAGVTPTNGTSLSIAFSLANRGSRGVSNVQVTSASLGSQLAISPSLPIAVGNMSAGANSPVTVQFNNASLVAGTRYLFTLRGTYILDAATYGFTVNSFVTLPGGSTSATVIVHTFYLDTSAPGNKGLAAGSGVYVRLNGQTVGQTDSGGAFMTQTSPGTINVQAEIPSTASGTSTVLLGAGQSGMVDILLDDSKEVTEALPLTSPEVVNGILDSSFQTFRLQFKQNGSLVPITTLDQVELVDPKGGASSFLDQSFVLAADGSITATNVNSLRSLFTSKTGKLTLRVVGEDNQGFTYANTLTFFFGLYSVQGSVLAPPSTPNLTVSGITLIATILGSDFGFTAVSGAGGTFQFPNKLPGGLVSVKAQTFQQGKYFYGNAQFALNSNKTLTLTMLNAQDLINKVPGFTVTGAAAFASASVTPTRFAVASVVAPVLLTTAASPTSVSTSATSGPQDVAISGTATLNVTKGTQKVILTYNVGSVEYPFYVLQQSIFNDLWTINVTAGGAGQQLFEQTRNVNAQLFIDPLWQSDGTTGQIKVDIDVTAIAANQDTTVTVYVAATNIGDNRLPTTVTASLSSDATITIDTVTNNDDVTTNNDGTYYSIPRNGSTNTIQRTFNLGITKSSTATVKSVSVILRSLGTDLATVINEQSPSMAWQMLDPNTIQATVTYKIGAVSGVNSQPPPSYNISYKFGVTVTDNGTDSSATPKESGPMHGLWRMPDGIARYGNRDTGGDDWCSRSTYNWITTNSGLLTRVDDISGEHGRDIGHDTHERGTDIDTFHFYTFPGGSGSGGTNYSILAQNVLAALSGDAAAKARVTSWASASRSGLDALLANGSVNFLYYAIGSATSAQFPQGANQPPLTISLGSGWASSLLRTGKVTASTGQALDLGLGQWANGSTSRMHFNAVHNSHVHVALVESGT